MWIDLKIYFYLLVALDYIISTSDDKEDSNSTAIDTIAAHFEGKNVTPKKMRLIEQYIDALFEDDEY